MKSTSSFVRFSGEKKTRTRGSLILKSFKILIQKVSWFWKFSENLETRGFSISKPMTDHPTLVFYPVQAEKLANIRLGGVINSQCACCTHKWALDKTQCKCPNCAILEVRLVMSYILHALPIQNFFCKSPSSTHKSELTL